MDKKRIRDQLNSSIKAMGEYINTHQIAIKQCKLDVADFEQQLKDLEPKGEFEWLVKGVPYWLNDTDEFQDSYSWENDEFDKKQLKALNVYQTKELCKMGHIRDVIARTKGDWDGEGTFFSWDGQEVLPYSFNYHLFKFNQPKFNTAKACDEFWTDEYKAAQKHFNTYN
jgi:hypothetical protein